MEWQTCRKREPPEFRSVMKGVTRWENIEETGDETKSTNHVTVLELWSIEVRSPKTRSWKARRAGYIDDKPTRGRHNQRQLNYVPIQGDAARNISQILRKRRIANIDRNSLQRCEKQSHNWELINPIPHQNLHQIFKTHQILGNLKSSKFYQIPNTISPPNFLIYDFRILTFYLPFRQKKI